MIVLQGLALSIVDTDQIESNQALFFYFIFSLENMNKAFYLAFCYEAEPLPFPLPKSQLTLFFQNH